MYSLSNADVQQQLRETRDGRVGRILRRREHRIGIGDRETRGPSWERGEHCMYFCTLQITFPCYVL